MSLADLVPEAFRLAERLAAKRRSARQDTGWRSNAAKAAVSAVATWFAFPCPRRFFWRSGFKKCLSRAEEVSSPASAEFARCFNGMALRGPQSGLTSAQVDTTYPHRLYLFSRRYLELDLPCLSWRIMPVPSIPSADHVSAVPRNLAPSRCVNPFIENPNRVPLDLDAPDLIAEVTSELLEEPPKLVVLSLAPEWAAQNEALARGGGGARS